MKEITVEIAQDLIDKANAVRFMRGELSKIPKTNPSNEQMCMIRIQSNALRLRKSEFMRSLENFEKSIKDAAYGD